MSWVKWSAHTTHVNGRNKLTLGLMTDNAKKCIGNHVPQPNGTINHGSKRSTLNFSVVEYIFKIYETLCFKRGDDHGNLEPDRKILYPKNRNTQTNTERQRYPIYSSKLEKELQEKGIKIGYTTKYHPHVNSVERYNRVIGRILKTYSATQHTKWPQYLDRVEYWINQLRSKVTEMTSW